MSAESWTALAAIASALSAIFAAVAAMLSRRQIVLAEKGAEAAVVLEIVKNWNMIYAEYRTLVNEPVHFEEVIKAKEKFDTYAATTEWKRMRPIFAFYEFLGAAIRTKFVKEHTLFSLVTVDTGLWGKYSPLILYFRDERPDLYTGWQYLVEQRGKYLPGKEHMPLKPKGLFSGLLGTGRGS